jgi:hypothetical protein
MKETDKYLAYVYDQWKSGKITEEEYNRQIDVITDFRIWIEKETK